MWRENTLSGWLIDVWGEVKFGGDKSVSFICKSRMSNSREPWFSGTSFPAAREDCRDKSGVNNRARRKLFYRANCRDGIETKRWNTECPGAPRKRLSTALLSFINGKSIFPQPSFRAVKQPFYSQSFYPQSRKNLDVSKFVKFFKFTF